MLLSRMQILYIEFTNSLQVKAYSLYTMRKSQIDRKRRYKKKKKGNRFCLKGSLCKRGLKRASRTLFIASAKVHVLANITAIYYK